MDLRLYADVLRRHRALVVSGFVLALVLALVTTVRVDSDGVQYRQSEEWSSVSRLGVTQRGFPWGRLLAQDYASLTAAQRSKAPVIPIADPNRFKDLAFLYAELATSDPVRRLLLTSGPIEGDVTAKPVIGENGITLPLIDVTATGTSPEAATALARRAADALDLYVQQQQSSNKVPASDRVILQRLLKPEEATISKPRPKSIPILVFLVVMVVTIGLAFARENMRPSVELVVEEFEETEPTELPRRITPLAQPHPPRPPTGTLGAGP